MRPFRHLAITAILTACSATLAAATFSPHLDRPPSSRQASTPSAASLDELFARDVWPILSSPKHDCVGCHTAQNPSNLHFGAGAPMNYTMLVEHGYLDGSGPGTLLSRVAASSSDLRMPPTGYQPLSPTEIATLKSFVAAVQASQKVTSGPPLDERFPPDLLTPYVGPAPSRTPDNTFLTYYQLQGKIRSIFHDDWQRDGHDQFEKYIDLFHGADFRTRFNESSTPSTEFLAGVDLLSADVASRSYLTSTGPFEGWPETVPAPTSAAPTPLYRRLIDQLFNRVLFRPPNPTEVVNSYRLLRSLYQRAPAVAVRPASINFTVTAEDPTGMSASENFTMPVASARYGLYQEYIDETATPDKDGVKVVSATKPGKPRRGRGGGEMVFQTLAEPVTLQAGDSGQSLRVDNTGTHGNVSVAGVVIEGPLPQRIDRHISVTDPSVQVEGGWEQQGEGDHASLNDRGDSKGEGAITFPLTAPTTGQYRLSVEWAESPQETNAPAVLVQVTQHGPSRLAMSPTEAPPPPGQARFTIDETIDDIAFWNLKPWFRFGKPTDGVEISNEGTHRRVVADAVRLVPRGGDPLLMRGDEAIGHEKWQIFKAGEFMPYNTTGPVLYQDENKDKGKLSLLYQPKLLGDLWRPNEFYQVQVGVPGHVDNDTAAPVIVHATESSPIIQVSHPLRVPEGALITLDGSGSYNLQRTPLKLTWQQTGGPRVQMVSDNQGARVTFRVAPLEAQQAGWEALCSALIRSPDFLFTRPISLATEHNPRVRRRLQLLKIAQDLVARAPTPEEMKRLDQGASLASFVNRYLDSQEFRDFYFRRIRLYLESHGSVVDDEPVRLWCYIAFHDIPFKQILSADYTVDPSMEAQPRPAYYGHSGLLLMKGFVRGKPGFPHFNYPAQVCEKFLGIVFQVPPAIAAMRNTVPASSLTNPTTSCYSCHKLLSPLDFQRSAWTDEGDYVPKLASGKLVDDTDRDLVPTYPYRGKGMQAFALAAQNKEAFVRTMIQTHFNFYFGRAMRYDQDERGFYLRLWNETRRDNYSIRGLIRALLTSPEYLNGPTRVRKEQGVRT